MKLSLEDKTKLIILSERASELLVEIMNEENPKERIKTKADINFQNTLSKIFYICPQLSDGYMKMYNFIQETKSKEEKLNYKKRLRLEDFGNVEEGHADTVY